jgi:hypothetical protein
MIGLLSSRLRRHPAGKQIERQRGSGLALPPAPTRGMFSKEIPVERSSPSLGAGVEQGASQEGEALGRARLFIARNLSGYLFLLPAIFIFVLFVWYPLVLGFSLSFQSVDMINPAVWVGWTN